MNIHVMAIYREMLTYSDKLRDEIIVECVGKLGLKNRYCGWWYIDK